jgi:integrase
VLLEALATLKARLDAPREALVFGTTRGAAQNPSNIRQRVLHPAVKRANANLAAQNRSPLPELTLHSLRRTYASILFAIGRSAPEVMQQLGHSDARLTLRIYARAMASDKHDHRRLKRLVEGDPLALLGTGRKNRRKLRPIRPRPAP